MTSSTWSWERFFFALLILFSILMAARNVLYYFTAFVIPFWIVMPIAALCAVLLLRIKVKR